MRKIFVLLGVILMMMAVGVYADTCEVCNETCSPCGGGCNATDLINMYRDTGSSFNITYGDITGWNTSCITSMNGLFQNTDFNQDISGWDTSSVTNMGYMFYSDGSTPSVFNQNISGWDVSHVTTFDNMFRGEGTTNAFDQDLSNWDVTNVTSAVDMFTGGNLSTANYDKLLNGWAGQIVNSLVELGAGSTQYTLMGKVGRDILTDTYNWTIYDGGLFCSPDWSCTGYGSCLNNDTQDCNAVTDLNTCGDTYLGDYSEFTPQVCDYCTPTWNCDGYASCLITDTQLCDAVTDNNTCYEETGLSSDNYSGNYSEFSPNVCDYCTPTWSCAAYGGCSNSTQNCTSAQDANGCYAITNLTIDQYAGNLSEFIQSPCLNCTPFYLCSGYGSCLTNDTQDCDAVVDNNTCGMNYTGNYSEYTPQACDYCTPDWVCSTYGICIAGSQDCNAASDTNYCYTLTSLPSDAYAGNLSEFPAQNCSVPPITGYVPAYGVGDLPNLTASVIGGAIVEVISIMGLIVLAVIVVVGATKLRKTMKGR